MKLRSGLGFRLDALDACELIEVAIERSDRNGIGSGDCCVVRIHKVHIGLRKISERALQHCFVFDFNSRGFNQVL